MRLLFQPSPPEPRQLYGVVQDANRTRQAKRIVAPFFLKLGESDLAPLLQPAQKVLEPAIQVRQRFLRSALADPVDPREVGFLQAIEFSTLFDGVRALARLLIEGAASGKPPIAGKSSHTCVLRQQDPWHPLRSQLMPIGPMNLGAREPPKRAWRGDERNAARATARTTT